MTSAEALEIQPVRARPAPRFPERRLAVAGGLACIGSVAVATATASADAAFGRGLLQLLVVGVPIGAGLYAVRAPINRSFGIALLWIGFTWSLTALTEMPLSAPHTIGRLATWLTFPGTVYLLLAFPDGRIQRGLDRALLLGVILIMLVLFFGTAPFVAAFPPKTLWSTCTTDCPANALFVLDRQPAFLTDIIRVREWLVELLWLGLFYSMFRRWRAASRWQRRAMGPAFVAGGLFGLAHYAHITARQSGAPADTVVALSSLWTLCIVAVCAAFLFGLVWRRALVAEALAGMGAALRDRDDPASIRDALAAAVGDPTAQPLFRTPPSGAWQDAWGRTIGWPPDLPPDHAMTVTGDRDRGEQLALIHDRRLLDDRDLLDGVSEMVLSVLRHERLTADLSRALTDLEESRRRIAEAADQERARIERDLHDGAQQRLVALRIRLGIAEQLFTTDPGAGMRELHELGFEAELALEDLRSLAHGVYPPLLTQRGLPEALRSLSTQAPVPVHMDAVGVTRHPIEVEGAVYFTCTEALQNASKHAGEAGEIWISLREADGRLRFAVRDDGSGFAVGDHDGRGLRNMHDRIEALGGDLTVASRPGHGTEVAGWVAVSSGLGRAVVPVTPERPGRPPDRPGPRPSSWPAAR